MSIILEHIFFGNEEILSLNNNSSSNENITLTLVLAEWTFLQLLYGTFMICNSSFRNSSFL